MTSGVSPRCRFDVRDAQICLDHVKSGNNASADQRDRDNVSVGATVHE